MRERIQQELTLLRRIYPDIEHAEHNGEDWFQVPAYTYPAGWRLGAEAVTMAPVLFKLGATYPTAQPYGFMTPAGLTFNGIAPNNTAAAPQGPFPGAWLFFSWTPDGNWQAAADAASGSNLLSWVRSFAQRLKEGV